MDVLHAYALLRDACQALDQSGDHAAAAHIGQGMALLEARYDIDPDAINWNDAGQIPPAAKPQGGRNHWA